MFLKRTGYPDEDELVLCTVTAVQYHSVFARLDEFERKTGMIHISEVAPGRIRNIRDYVVEGKKVVCKVLRVNMEKGHIDLSLRRVNEAQKRNKLSEIKQEQLSEKIIEYVAKELGKPARPLFEKVHKALTKEYESIFAAFEAVVAGKLSLAKLLDKALAQKLEDAVKQRIKPPEVVVEGDFTITSFASDGVDVVKKSLAKALQVKGEISLRNAGGGKYHIVVKAPDYKKAEKVLKQSTEEVCKFARKNKAVCEFTRTEK